MKILNMCKVIYWCGCGSMNSEPRNSCQVGPKKPPQNILSCAVPQNHLVRLVWIIQIKMWNMCKFEATTSFSREQMWRCRRHVSWFKTTLVKETSTPIFSCFGSAQPFHAQIRSRESAEPSRYCSAQFVSVLYKDRKRSQRVPRCPGWLCLHRKALQQSNFWFIKPHTGIPLGS